MTAYVTGTFEKQLSTVWLKLASDLFLMAAEKARLRADRKRTRPISKIKDLVRSKCFWCGLKIYSFTSR